MSDNSLTPYNPTEKRLANAITNVARFYIMPYHYSIDLFSKMSSFEKFLRIFGLFLSFYIIFLASWTTFFIFNFIVAIEGFLKNPDSKKAIE